MYGSIGRGEGSMKEPEGGASKTKGVGSIEDVPFEFVGKVSSSSAWAKPSHIEGSASSGHDEIGVNQRMSKKGVVTRYKDSSDKIGEMTREVECQSTRRKLRKALGPFQSSGSCPP